MVYVPILKWAGLDYKNVVIPLGLLLNGLNTLLALIPYHKAKLVDYRGMWPMGVTAVIFAPIGALVTPFVPKKTLILLFVVFVFMAAFKVFYDFWKTKKAGGVPTEKMLSLAHKQWIGALFGILIGFIGGLLGIGGGFIIAPVLMWLGYSSKKAAATTAFVVTFSSLSGYMGHLSKGIPLTSLTFVVILAVILGSQLGSNFMVKKIKGSQVKLIYGGTLVLIAAKMLFDLF